MSDNEPESYLIPPLYAEAMREELERQFRSPISEWLIQPRLSRRTRIRLAIHHRVNDAIYQLARGGHYRMAAALIRVANAPRAMRRS